MKQQLAEGVLEEMLQEPYDAESASSVETVLPPKGDPICSFPQRREIGENHSRQAFRDIGKANFGAISGTERCCSAISHNVPPKIYLALV